MKRLLINDYGVFLGRKGDRIVVKRGGEKVGEFPAGNVSQVIVATRGVTLSTDFLRLLIKHRIDLVILSGTGVPIGRLLSIRRKRGVKLRRAQYEAQGDWRGVHLAKQFAKAKVLNQRYLIRSLAKSRVDTNPRLYKQLMRTYEEMAEYVSGIEAVSGGRVSEVRQAIMNLEGKAAEKYWNAVKLIIPEELGFPGRRKRFDRPRDPVNILLNFAYGILYSEVWLALEYTSLDPYAGFLHVDSPRRPALVMDLVEEFRQPVVDRVVLKLASAMREKLNEYVDDEGKLSNEGRKLVSKEIADRLRRKVTFQDRSLPIEYHITLQARRLSEFIIGRSNTYIPFVMK